MEPVRIVYVIDALEPGGTERHLVELIGRFRPGRLRAEIVCLRQPAAIANLDAGCPIRVLGITKLCSAAAARAVLHLASHLRRERTHVVQTFFFDACVIGTLAARLARVPLLIASRRDLGFWHTRGTRLVVRILDRMVDRILVNANAIRSALIASDGLPADRIDVIRNGVNVEGFGSGDAARRESARRIMGVDDDATVVGLVANLNRPVKDVDTFIGAAARVRHVTSTVRFVIIGDGALRRGLESYAGRLALDGHLIFLGRVSEASRVIPGFDVGVLSSRSEGLPNAVLEYMAAGIPTIATRVGGIPELIEDGRHGLLVPAGDAEAMADAMGRLVASAELRKRMGRASLDRARTDFRLDTEAEACESYYRMRLSEASGRSIPEA